MSAASKLFHNNLSWGDISLCRHDESEKVAIVHACKDPCHKRAVGYRGNLPSSHQNYLALEKETHLYLNLIDPPAPLFMLASFVTFLEFVDRHIGERQVVIHCNLGESRAPSLALLYLSKRLQVISSESYEAAARGFRDQFGIYAPGTGIQRWLSAHWNEIQ